MRAGLAALAAAVLAVLATPAQAADPVGPEACLADELNQRRAGSLAWSGVVRDELRSHAAAMAGAGRVSHAAMSYRVSALPDGWEGYGETASVEALHARDEAGVRDWCRRAVEALWRSDPHRKVLADPAYDFVSVGIHWDGERIWIAIGAFAHSSHTPPPPKWPTSYSSGLVGPWRGTFADDDRSLFEPAIEALARHRLTEGCNPPLNTRFCPDQALTRGQLAAFLTRAFRWPLPSTQRFTDTVASPFRAEIEAMAAAGVTEGCNPPRNDRFCPDRTVTRGEMATFLVRALSLGAAPVSPFVDTAHSVHRRNIDSLAAAGITAGCNRAGDRFCPDAPVTRAQLAAFFQRAGMSD